MWRSGRKSTSSRTHDGSAKRTNLGCCSANDPARINGDQSIVPDPGSTFGHPHNASDAHNHSHLSASDAYNHSHSSADQDSRSRFERRHVPA